MEQICAETETPGKKTTDSTTNEGEDSIPENRNKADNALSSDATEKQSEEEEEGNKMSLVCWNLDGLDGEKQPERARALCSYLNSHLPDVVFLQELIQPYIRFVKKCLEISYTFIEGGREHYFTGMLLKKSRITLLDSEIVNYPTSRMGRNLLVAQVLFKGQKLCLMTSHFESCKANAGERMRQLHLVMKRMTEVPDDVTVLFGGDTNLRDAEVAKVGLPSCVCDVWEQLGRPEHCRYTWDTHTNTNRDIQFKCRLRFDRLYLRGAFKDGVPKLEPDSMTLIGLEKLECGLFISDHWGIHCTFCAK